MDAILHVFSEVLSLQVSAEQIDRGQNLLRTAAWIVAASADTPSEVVDSERQYPWAAEHINDRSVSGSPPVIAEAVAAYWTGLERRVLEPGQPDDSPLAYQWPRPGEPLAARAQEDPASRIAVMLSRAVGESDQLNELGTVQADHEGEAVEHTKGSLSVITATWWSPSPPPNRNRRDPSGCITACLRGLKPMTAPIRDPHLRRRLT